MNVLPNLSPIVPGAPGLLQPAVTQRHIETEVAKCVGGVGSPLLSNVALSVLDEHIARAPGGPASSEWQRAVRRRQGLPNFRLVR
jgi:hypothetical protein